jgi:hypothetical protein
MDRTDIAGAIARFLGLWIRRLDKLRRRPGQVFLPFAFADQGSTWLRGSTDDGHHAAIAENRDALNAASRLSVRSIWEPRPGTARPLLQE